MKRVVTFYHSWRGGRNRVNRDIASYAATRRWWCRRPRVPIIKNGRTMKRRCSICGCNSTFCRSWGEWKIRPRPRYYGHANLGTWMYLFYISHVYVGVCIMLYFPWLQSRWMSDEMQPPFVAATRFLLLTSIRLSRRSFLPRAKRNQRQSRQSDKVDKEKGRGREGRSLQRS